MTITGTGHDTDLRDPAPPGLLLGEHPPDETATAAVASETGPVRGTATGTAGRNVDGRAIALTVFSTVRWWGRAWLPGLFLFLQLRPQVLRVLRELSFIHAARWVVVDRLPDNGPGAPGRRLRDPYLFFESNFNDGWEEYIDAFSYVLGRGMGHFWRSSYGYPGARPTGPFKAYIRDNEVEADHYASAYPDATTTMVLSALALEPRVRAFAEQTGRMSPPQLEVAWAAFLTDVQALL